MASLRNRVIEGDLVLGTMVMEFATPHVGRIAEVAGAEFVLFDMEHTSLSIDQLSIVAATMAGSETACWVRAPRRDYDQLGRLLDVGATGVMLPSVESAAQAEWAVDGMKYAPDGHRGVALGIAHDRFVRGAPGETMATANESNIVLAQIETGRGVENVDEIAAVPGVDVLWVGHNDLTTSLGIPGEFDNPTYLDAIARVAASAAAHGKAAGFRPDSVDHALAVIDVGYRCIGYLSDITAYRSAIASGIAQLRADAS